MVNLLGAEFKAWIIFLVIEMWVLPDQYYDGYCSDEVIALVSAL